MYESNPLQILIKLFYFFGGEIIVVKLVDQDFLGLLLLRGQAGS